MTVSIYQLKPAFQKLLQPLLGILIRAGASPNQVTIAAIALSALGGFMLWQAPQLPGMLLILPLILLLRMVLNALDGMLARTCQQSTVLGEILNELGDVVSDVILYLPLIVHFQNSLMTIFFIGLFVVLSVISEFSGILTKSITGTRRYDGPMGKSDRAFAISLFILSHYFLPGFTSFFAIPFFILLSGLLIVSCCNRLKSALKGA
jgi:CDP-diacylglycerol---glycerol-3-phosphate 3-phosphatidyltransferase